MLSIKYGEDNPGGKFRDIMLKMFMQILANNAGCTKNNEQKKKKTQKTPDSHRSLDNDSLDSKYCGFSPKWASNYFDDVFLLRTVFGIYPINTKFSTSHICR